MIEAFKIFDNYGLKARLYPALIAGLPLLSLIFVLVKWDHIGLPHAIALTVSSVLLFSFADIARRAGRRIETKIGSRSTPHLLRYTDHVFDAASKTRYRAFLSSKIGMSIPSEQDELTHPESGNVFYQSATNWLRENTRDTKKYSILFNELVTYGFRRNLLGLKWISIFLNFIVLVVATLLILNPPPFILEIDDIQLKLSIVIIAAILHTAFMFFAVNTQTVLDASQAYGRQLILSCEILGGHPTPSRTSRRKGST